MESYEIILFYKYVHIAEPEVLREEQRALCARLGMTGRIIIASEGVNVTLEGTKSSVQEYLDIYLADPRFSNTHIKRSPGTGNAFPKLSVKTRAEIVTLGLGVCDVDPNVTTGIHLKPAELHEWIEEKKEFYIVDMRNAYEHKVGHFEGSTCPPLDNFRDLPKFIETIAHLKNKTVLTVCTGGVRCEKASGYLITQGFTDVYQLDGGIVSYMEQYPNEDFVGKLYVFDRRLMMGFYTDDAKHKIVGKCEQCNEENERFVNCDVVGCHRHFLLCENCEQEMKKKKGIMKCPGKCTISRSGNKVPSPFMRGFFAGKQKIRALSKSLFKKHGK